MHEAANSIERASKLRYYTEHGTGSPLLLGITGSRLVIIDGADHALIWAHPGQLLAAVDDFLRTA